MKSLNYFNKSNYYKINAMEMGHIIRKDSRELKFYWVKQNAFADSFEWMQ